MPSMNREGFQANFTPIFHKQRQSRQRGPRCQTFQEPSFHECEACILDIGGGALRRRKIDEGSRELAPPKELWLAALIRPADSI